MDRLCDLHTHSVYSDGTCTPEEILTLAEEAGLSAVALCDHNTVAGLPAFMEAAKSSKVRAVPGIEISADYSGREVHILGLFIQPCSYSRVSVFLEEVLIQKEESNLRLVAALEKHGIHIDYHRLKSESSGGQINRAVIAAEMVKKGYCQSVKEAFSGFLSQKNGLYIPPGRLDAFAVIRFIKSVGSAAVLAHPFLNLDESQLLRFLPDARENGLDGMEVYYPLFSEDETVKLKEIANRFLLRESGGSDFHGANKPDIFIGSGKGNLCVQEELMLRLSECTNYCSK